MPLSAEVVDKEIIVEERTGRRTFSIGMNRTTTYGSWSTVIDAEGNELDPYPLERERGCVELLSRCGGSVSPADDPDEIPIEVARLGKPAIAMYLRLFFELSNHEIGELLQVERESVSQYLTDFRHGRR